MQPQKIHKEALRGFIKKHSLLDLTSLIPLWVTYHGWIRNISELRCDKIDHHDENWMDSTYFHTQIACPPYPKLSQQTVENWSRNQLKQRQAIIKHLHSGLSEALQQFKIWNELNPSTPWHNTYDAVDGYNTYLNLWQYCNHKWAQKIRFY